MEQRFRLRKEGSSGIIQGAPTGLIHNKFGGRDGREMEQISKKRIACIFPGIGYTCDKPLLYYSEKLLRALHWDVIRIQYQNLPEKVRGDQEKMQMSINLTWEQTRDKLRNIDWGSYSQILFISKSIGTINAVAYSNGCELPCRHILFTPLEGTFSLPIKEGIAFHGTADPWADTQKIRNLAKAKNVPLTIIDDANHSLETGDIVVDIKNLETVMQQVKDYVMAPSPERMSD